jgi:tetratricopeptide (TPR) repeat protein
LVFHVLFLSAQLHKIDSLYAVLKPEKEDTNKVNTLNSLSWNLSKISRYGPADSLAKVSLELASKINFKIGIGYAYRNLGDVSESRGNFEDALNFCMLGLKVFEDISYKRGIRTMNGDIGDIYLDQGNYPEALKAQLQSLKISEELNDVRAEANANLNIGNILSGEGNNLEALKKYNQALEQYQKLGYTHGIGTARMNIGDVYESLHNYPEALNNYFESLKIDQELQNTDGVAGNYGNIGAVYQEQKNYLKAIENYFVSLNIYKQIGNKQGIGESFVNLGGAFYEEKKYGLARSYLDSAMVLLLSVGDKENIKQGYLKLAYLDSATNNYKTAFEDYKNYTLYKDSLVNEEKTKKIVSEQMQYEFDKKQAEEKAEQDKKDALIAADKKKQKIVTWSVVSGLLLVMGFAGFVFRSLRITRKQKQVIEIKNKETEGQKKIIEEKQKDILDSITYAKRLQEAILPPLSIIKKYLPESFILYKPKDIIAGDFYWMDVADDIVLLAACDCTGHGVPGAMVSVVCSNALNRALKEFKIHDSGKLLDKTRDLVLETFAKSGEIKDGMDMSFCAINKKTNHLEWSGANNPLWYVRNGEMKELNPDKQPIGQSDIMKPFTTHTMELQKGDVLYLFTDGYADQFGGEKGKKFKYQQFKNSLLAISQLAMNKQKEELDNIFETWKGHLEQVDDVLVMGIRV